MATPAGFGGTGFFDENTLDESIWQTLKRDVFTIGRNLRSVLIPVNWDFQNHQAALHNWDLWGPLVSCSSSSGRQWALQEAATACSSASTLKLPMV